MFAKARSFTIQLGRNRAVASALDPLVTSATMFIVQCSVLLTVSKLEFATYSLAYSYIVMGQAVLSALFGAPLITVLGEIPEGIARQQAGLAALRLQLLFALALGISGLALAFTIGIPTATAALAVTAMVGLSYRDAFRNVLAAQFKFSEASRVALLFAGIITATLYGVWLYTGHITADGGLAALAIGALLVVAPQIARALASASRLPSEALQELWSMAAWSVPGAIVIWLQNSFYLTLIAINLSFNAVGEVSSARMVAMPLLVVASGLLRFTQVRAGRQLKSQGSDSAICSARRLAVTCFILGGLAIGACWIAASLIGPTWLPHAYPHLLWLAGLWLGFATATIARGCYSSLFQAMGRYREIFILNLLILPFVLFGIIVGPQILGLPGAIIPMVVGEITLMLLLAARARTSRAF